MAGRKVCATNAVRVEISVTLTYLSSFWRTLKMAFIISEIYLLLASCVITTSADTTTLAITDTEPYAPVVAVLAQSNWKLLQQLKSRFKRIFFWNKFQPKVTMQAQNQ